MKPRQFVLPFVAGLLLVLGVIAAACGDDGQPSITVEDLTGTYFQSSASVYARFDEDGTFRVANSVAKLDENPDIDLGQFLLEGTLITLMSSDESPTCPGLSGSYQVELTEEGRLQFVLEEDPCGIRKSPTSGAASGPLRRISP